MHQEATDYDHDSNYQLLLTYMTLFECRIVASLSSDKKKKKKSKRNRMMISLHGERYVESKGVSVDGYSSRGINESSTLINEYSQHDLVGI